MTSFAPFVLFQRHFFENKTVCIVSDLSWESHNGSFSELQVLQRVRFCFKKFASCKILSRNNYNVSGLKLKKLKRVRFLLNFPPPVRFFENFTLCQILFDVIQKESIFELKTSKNVIFRKMLYSKVHMAHFVPPNGLTLPPLCFFKGKTLKKKQCALCQTCHQKITTCQILKKKFYNVSNHELKTSQRVGFRLEKFTTFHALN